MAAMFLKFSKKLPNLEPGLHHYQREIDGFEVRLHLRIDQDGHGTLILNANRVIHFNPSAAFMAFLILEAYPTETAIKAIRNMFRVSTTQAKEDFEQFNSKLIEILHPNTCPVCSIEELEITAPFSERPSAPYRMDLALTYRCNNDCAHCYNSRPRDYPELTTDEWIKIIDRLWELAIPHIVFTGGEPTLRDDLHLLIAHAENNGQITGLNTNGRRLSQTQYIHSLVDAGLDHVQITLESHDPDIHDQMVNRKGAWEQTVNGLKNALDSPLYVMTNTTMLQSNAHKLKATLDYLAKTGLPTVGLNALIYSGKGLNVGTGIPESELPQLLEIARERTSAHNQRLIWYTPTQYCQFDPMQLELGIKGCTAALYNMCIEPDGGVIPCQSYYYQMGNILHDPWASIWNHKLAIRLREREYVPDECQGCLLLSECGGGCPLALQAAKQDLITIERKAIIADPFQ